MPTSQFSTERSGNGFPWALGVGSWEWSARTDLKARRGVQTGAGRASMPPWHSWLDRPAYWRTCKRPHMPDMDGLSVVRQLHDLTPAPKVVLLTAHIHEDQLIESLQLGIRGVVLKEMAPRLLVQCLQRVSAGGQWLEKESAGRAMTKLVRQEALREDQRQPPRRARPVRPGVRAGIKGNGRKGEGQSANADCHRLAAGNWQVPWALAPSNLADPATTLSPLRLNPLRDCVV
jgi:hypothetical protein